MPQQHRTHLAAKAGPGRPHTASPQTVLAAIDGLAAAIKNDRASPMYGLWAVRALADRLDIAAALSGSTDCVEVITDLGDSWATEVSKALDDPAQVATALRSASATIRKVADDVQRRGLAG